MLATWDDHDGKDDAGVEWALKGVAQEAFLDFFGVPEASPRRAREGVYHSSLHGPSGRRLQVILLDTRTHRTALTRNSGDRGGRGPYLPEDRPDQTMLGPDQWSWLEDQLRLPTCASSCPRSRWSRTSTAGKAGATCPPSARGVRPHRGHRRRGVVFLSGDRHLIDLSPEGGAPLWDFLLGLQLGLQGH